MSEFKGTKNWRIRKVNEDFFFIEADLPDAEKNGHYPRLEVMQEDFGEHNGYTYELRMSDALLISKAPEMLEFIKTYYRYLNLDDQLKAEQLIKEATEL